MKVKWRGLSRKVWALLGDGPRDIEEYLSQSNRNVDFLSQDKKYKFIDDLSIIEMLNLISIALSSYNFQQHVASDFAIGNETLEPKDAKSQEYLDNISTWTKNQEMKLNCEKTEYMRFNPSKTHQINTRLNIEGQAIDQVHEARLLGVIMIRFRFRYISKPNISNRLNKLRLKLCQAQV